MIRWGGGICQLGRASVEPFVSRFLRLLKVCLHSRSPESWVGWAEASHEGEPRIESFLAQARAASLRLALGQTFSRRAWARAENWKFPSSSRECAVPCLTLPEAAVKPAAKCKPMWHDWQTHPPNKWTAIKESLVSFLERKFWCERVEFYILLYEKKLFGKVLSMSNQKYVKILSKKKIRKT